MYKFVDTTEGAQGTSMSIQTIFNNFNLDELLTDENGSFITLTVSGRSDTHKRISLINVTGMHGAWEENDSYREPREIVVKYKIKDKSNEGIRKRFDRLKAYLGGSKKVLSFTDEEAIFYATLSILEVPEEDSNDLVGTITFLCSDPDKYGPEQTKSFESDALTITNDGTAAAEPIFELTVKKPTTYAMIQNYTGEYMMIGRPADVSEEVVNTRTLLLEERGQTLNTWTAEGTDVDGSGVRIVGSLSTDNDGITVPDYGTGERWHGPAHLKEVPPVQDFEVEMMLEARFSGNVNQTYRIEFYLFDENNKVLGKMAILDNSTGFTYTKAEGRAGPFRGGNVNYPISSRNYTYDWNNFYGMLRMRRVGQQFEFYVTRVANDTRHVFSLKEYYFDGENEFLGKLKYVQIHIGAFGNLPKVSNAKINHIKVYELARETVDETPYILYPDDKVILDNKDDDILINGEPRNDLKNFGGSFFTLKPGENALIASPENTFDATCRYREKFK